MSKDTGGPAFPSESEGMLDNEGMTLRDYFAAKAMQGLLSLHNRDYYADDIACKTYKIADAMLLERDK